MTEAQIEGVVTEIARCLSDVPESRSFTLADCNGWTEDKAREIYEVVIKMLAAQPSTPTDVTPA